MNLTVAMRVIGGFVVISLLLIALGISSISSVQKIGSASQELSTVALPTVAGSSDLKASFLNLGRLTFEGFVSQSKETVTSIKEKYENAQQVFNQEFSTLKNVVQNDDELSSAVQKVQVTYEEYSGNSRDMFSSHLKYIESNNTLDDIIAELEESVDDASSLLLDFADLDEVSQSSSLQSAANLSESFESTLLSLLASSTEFRKTQTSSRAELRQKDVEVILQRALSQSEDIMQAANGQDDSGMLDEVAELMETINTLISSASGLLNEKSLQLQAASDASKFLKSSEDNITLALTKLESLNKLADSKALSVKNSVASQTSSSTTTVVVVIIFSLIVATGISYISVRAITQPLSRVNELLKIASSGDLTHRLDESSQDEFGLLAKNCNFLIDNLKQLIHTINQRADQLAAASGQTSNVTRQTTDSIEDQKSQISQIASATTELHTTSEMVSENAEDTRKQIKHAEIEAENVKSISNDNKTTIQVLAKDVQEAADVINQLHQDSASIGGILDVIRGVADQTNLLALNAAIEAARAGEQGRGFAVVADEVRTLASRTQESTQEINSMIEVLQAGAEKAVSVMNQGKEQTVVCVEKTEKAGAALNLITDAVHNAYEVSARIEQAAKEQYTVSAEISERLENIVGIAEQTTLGAKQTSDSSAEVARLAEELQESIGRFKV